MDFSIHVSVIVGYDKMDYKGRIHFPPVPLSKPMTDRRGKRLIDPPSAQAQNW